MGDGVGDWEEGLVELLLEDVHCCGLDGVVSIDIQVFNGYVDEFVKVRKENGCVRERDRALARYRTIL